MKAILAFSFLFSFSAQAFEINGPQARSLMNHLVAAGAVLDCGVGTCGVAGDNLRCSQTADNLRSATCSVNLEDETGALVPRQMTELRAASFMGVLIQGGFGGCVDNLCQGSVRTVVCISRNTGSSPIPAIARCRFE